MSVKLNTEEFIKKAKEVHGDKYDYSLVEYITVKEKVIIICKIHGIFNQTPGSHLSGSGCKICAVKSNGVNHRASLEDFIKKSIEIHGDKYDYGLVDYKKSREKVKIICPIHGIFEQIANVHLNGSGCNDCGISSNIYKQSLNTNSFIKRAKEVHGDKYDYSLVNYVNNIIKVKIICKIHGEFEQNPNSHLRGSGCNKCKSSKGEIMIRDFLLSKNIIFEEQKRFPDCKYKLPLPFDFFIPDYNIAIEFDGFQHYIPHSFSSDTSPETKNKNLQTVKFRDSIKTDYCKKNDIKLIRISYLEKNDIYNILSRILFNNFEYSFDDCF